MKGHMVQKRQNVRSTKRKHTNPIALHPPNPVSIPPSNELHIRVQHISKLYTDDTGKFPVRSRTGNQYNMVAYHCDSNAILAVLFTSRKDQHRLQAYDKIMQQLTDRGMIVDLLILDNEANAAYKRIITTKWEVDSQLAPPPHIHRRKVDERAIRTFKAHFPSILDGVADDYPRNLWDLLLPQSVLTLNLLRQATLNPNVLTWEFLEGPLDYNANPLAPLGCPVMIHKKTATRNSWEFQRKEGWSIGTALDH